ncbi:MAG TPA: HAD family hydrolase [Anaerolineales bacterium]|nr:HAD family hydrolase [Anaerolineales bacterium]
MYPAIFLDRDGVLIENRPDYVREGSQARLFPETIPALARTELKSYRIVIVTNQSVVGRGLIPLEKAQEINARLVDLIRGQGGRLDRVYMCPHGPGEGCACRKPNPGLLLQAAADLSIDLPRSWMIGDAWTDLQAGRAAGVQGLILVRTGRGEDQLLQPQPEDIIQPLILGNLELAIDTILQLDKARTLNESR